MCRWIMCFQLFKPALKSIYPEALVVAWPLSIAILILRISGESVCESGGLSSSTCAVLPSKSVSTWKRVRGIGRVGDTSSRSNVKSALRREGDIKMLNPRGLTATDAELDMRGMTGQMLSEGYRIACGAGSWLWAGTSSGIGGKGKITGGGTKMSFAIFSCITPRPNPERRENSSVLIIEKFARGGVERYSAVGCGLSGMAWGGTGAGKPLHRQTTMAASTGIGHHCHHLLWVR